MVVVSAQTAVCCSGGRAREGGEFDLNLTGCVTGDTVRLMQKGGLKFLYPPVDDY